MNSNNHNKLDDSLKISKTDEILFKEGIESDAESDYRDINDRTQTESHGTLKNVHDRSHKSKYNYSKDYEMIKNLKNGVYINENGDESFLSDTSYDANSRIFKLKGVTKQIFQHITDYPKISKRISKIALPNAKVKKSHVQKVGLLDYPKKQRMSNAE